jgi:5'-3' exonuclease
MVDLKGKVPIVDGDTIIYSSAFACQKDGVAEEPRNAFYNAKLMMKKILNEFGTDDEWRLFIGGKDNFRVSLATILPYKGNRPPKPILYNDVRNYLIDFWNAEVVDGMEAEDMAAITYNEDTENQVLCAVDKDCLQVPGHHWNYQKGSYQYISPLEGNKRFWSQVLTGDKACDNILGIPKLGEKKAAGLTKDVRTFRQGWQVVKDAYYEAFGKQRCLQIETPKGIRWGYEKGSGLVREDGTVMDWKEALVENCRLIYLLREEGKHFEPLD